MHGSLLGHVGRDPSETRNPQNIDRSFRQWMAPLPRGRPVRQRLRRGDNFSAGCEEKSAISGVDRSARRDGTCRTTRDIYEPIVCLFGIAGGIFEQGCTTGGPRAGRVRRMSGVPLKAAVSLRRPTLPDRAISFPDTRAKRYWRRQPGRALGPDIDRQHRTRLRCSQGQFSRG